MSLHTAHGEAGHGPMPLIGQGTEITVNPRDQIVDHKPPVGPAPRTAHSAKPATSAGTASAAARRGSVRPAGRSATKTSASPEAAHAGAAHSTGFHNNNHGLGP